jgi:fructose 1,6-bisphosphate aldolase/phosphatase
VKLTLSVIKADIGSIGGHIRPSAMILDCVRRHVQAERGRMLIDCHIGATGDDIAILMTQTRGAGDARIHKLVSCPRDICAF